MVYQFRFEIRDMPVPVWREVFVCDYFFLHDLHLVMQGSFGWENRHLYEFQLNEGISVKTYGDIVFNEDPDLLDSRKAPLKKFFKKNGDSLKYVYDFGDYWQHTITLIATDKKRDIVGAYCTDGSGRCPPEDVGGPPGYHEMVRAFKGPVRPEKLAEYREWLGMKGNKVWHPDAFNARTVNKRLCLIE